MFFTQGYLTIFKAYRDYSLTISHLRCYLLFNPVLYCRAIKPLLFTQLSVFSLTCKSYFFKRVASSGFISTSKCSPQLHSRYQASLLYYLKLFQLFELSFNLLDPIFRSLGRFLQFGKFLRKLFLLTSVLIQFQIITLPTNDKIY